MVPRLFFPKSHWGSGGGSRLSRGQWGLVGEQHGSGGEGKGQLPVVPLHFLALPSSAPWAEACDVEPVPSQASCGVNLPGLSSYSSTSFDKKEKLQENLGP